MSGNSFGTILRISSFGESHGPALGVCIDGLPAGIAIEQDAIQRELDRRRPGQSSVSTPRSEGDRAEILSGVFEGKSTGCPIAIIVRNRNQNSSAYDTYRDLYRPGHADYSYNRKFGFRDHRGGGRSSGRETAARVAAGAVAKALLANHGIAIRAWTAEAAGIQAQAELLEEIENNSMRCCDPEAAEKMKIAVEHYAEAGNSCGGIVACRVEGVPAGLGEPVFDKLDARLAAAMLSLGAVKGFEIGSGFAAAGLSGREQNDQMHNGSFLSNNAGGVLGGISTGERIDFRIAVKPTPSISMKQKTINTKGENREISVTGRHDPCICPRIVPVVEAMCALVLADFLLLNLRNGRY